MKYSVIFAVLALGAAPAAHSQCCGYGMSYDNVVVWPQPDLRVPVPTRTEVKKAPPILPKSKPAIQANARTLAQHFPPEKRAEMENIYVKSMDVYLQVEKKLGWTPRDMAGGLAAFLVGNYMVLKGVEVSDEEFAAVANQMRAQNKLQGVNTRAEADKVRDVFEQSAMIGAFMALAFKSNQQQPQPPAVYENLRNAARENLQLVLKGDPSNLLVDKNGMRFQ
ncbi:DUF6683 family protein [Pseudoduganella violaceinigra]|uniref:DUF6683 family protein n=1 Tax=Pseudoduganella violaceinigra TaxID=246602 RepID=UPI000407B451|nr:DUF6683 family protein [Pseudoduganella violaceinigra]